MSDADSFSAYLQLAEKVFKREVKLNALSAFISTLPRLDRELLEHLAEESEKASLSQPRMSWAICCVAEKTSRLQKLDLFTRSLAAWYLGRAANRWVQPQKIAKAITRARRGFVKLGDTGWVAACDWMANDLPWLNDDLITTEETLVNITNNKDNSIILDFLPHCLLALAETQILLEKHTDAMNNINLSANLYKDHHDDLNIARCWMVKANCLRRQSNFSEAKEYFENSEVVLKNYYSIKDIGRLYFYSGILNLFSTTDFTLTEEKFNNALVVFSKTDLDLWKGMSFTFLGVTSVQDGQLDRALSLYLKANAIFHKYSIESLTAQNNNALGRVYSLLGNLDESINYLENARISHIKNGRFFMAARDTIAIGDNYFQQGRYQDALHSYESILEYFSIEKDKVQIGLYQLNLSNYWIRLSNYSIAEKYLNLAESNLRISNQLDSKINLLNLRARIKFELGQIEESEKYLMEAIEIVQGKRLRPQLAVTQLNLGDVLISEQNITRALHYLLLAKKEFKKMGMDYELVSCLISIGTCYINSKQDLAKIYFNNALQVSLGSFIDLEWRALAGLAEIEKTENAILSYKQAVQAISKVKTNLWQPNLASFYVNKPIYFFNKAIMFASQFGYLEELIEFIEAGKFISLLQGLTFSQIDKKYYIPRSISILKANINKIKRKIYRLTNFNQSINKEIETIFLQKKLAETIKIYDEHVSQNERKYSSIRKVNSSLSFSVPNFRHQANEHFAQKWLSINYHMSSEFLYITVITPNKLCLKTIPLTSKVLQLIRKITNNQNRGFRFFQDELKIIGGILIPDEILSQCTSDTILLIVPHNRLHGIPWAAIGNPPLVQKCIPIIIPSLQVLESLWKRSEHKYKTINKKGLLIGISNFEGRYPSLESVETELEIIHSSSVDNCEEVYTNINTFKELEEIMHRNAEEYEWLHLATHFFNDKKTGRIGGFALKKEDVWLDQIRDLSPLPRLITLSGCNSLYGSVSIGDEQISLSSTCFLAGAESIIGSLWPIIDNSTTNLMNHLYLNIHKALSPSDSLSLAQRNAIETKEDLSTWCSYLNLGSR